MTNRNVPLRGIADSTKRESAPPAGRLAVVKLEILFPGRRLDHCHGSDAMMTSRNVPLRGNADSTKRESAPPAHDDKQERPAARERRLDKARICATRLTFWGLRSTM
ncbi:MAG TPA: hypothetical protein VJW77_06110 [Terriglobia bacterium]|nr:hypothetical protein [Terriglobia bacterium]